MSEKTCDFCGKKLDEVTKIFSSETSHICNECVTMCGEVLHKEEMKATKQEFQKGLTIPEALKEHLDNYVIGQEEAKKILSVALYNHYKRIDKPTNNDVELEKSNVLLIGPTGSGKTLLASSLARIMEVPFATSDATALTEAGYVGEDVESILSRLLVAADYDIEKAQKGIVYVDEIDKIAHKGESSTVSRDVSGEGVQQGLLKILEGAEVYVPVSGSKKNSSAETVLFDTTHVLFVVGGAFVGLIPEDESHKRHKDITMGFITDETQEVKKKIEAKELMKYGLIPEFIGRIPIIATLKKLSIEDLVKVLKEPKNAIIKQYQYLFELDGVDLEFEESAIEEVAKMAYDKEVGARGLRSIIEDILLPLQYEVPSKEKLLKCIITKEYILGEAEATYIFDEPKKKPARKRTTKAPAKKKTTTTTAKKSAN
jgi:ATP-dependent Clp protease ATP-binding subunit ClpX